MIKSSRLFFIVITVVFSLLFVRLVQLQVAESQQYQRLATENAAKTVADPAPRGIIYDRRGQVLVENRPIFSVRVLPHVLAGKPEAERARILKLLTKLLGEEIKFKPSATEPIIVKDNISLETAIRIDERQQQLDGVIVGSRPVRLSKYETTAAHLIGFVGEIESAELERLKPKGYRLGDTVGKDGVEKTYDELIRGVNGGKMVEVDVHGTPLRILESLEPLPGADVKLAIDLDLQLAAEKALGEREGAVVVLETKSGAVLALASYPNYNPNIFTDPKENWRWQELKRQKHPFINRALAIYPPGSVFKVVTLAAALSEKKVSLSEVINCRSYYRINNRIANCWLGTGHGPITVLEGLIWSCDVVFYELGKRLGPDTIAKYAQAFGLGSRSGIDLPQEKKGTAPTASWKKEYLKEPWYEGDSINYGIGQGFVQVTPLQLALLYASIATGTRYRPYVVSEITSKTGNVLYKATPGVISKVPISEEVLKLIRKSLREVVRRGTGVAANVPGIPAAGKTGTAENPGRAHAWFVCYAPYDKPEIAISVFVAHGEHGDKASAYVARDILKWYKENRLKTIYPKEIPEAQYIIHGNQKVPYLL